jgi:hypothetical protein
MRLHECTNAGRGARAAIARTVLGRFLHREDGTITTFALMIFVLMVAVGGIAIDIMRYETQRAQLQYTLDRAVLSAASVTQPLNHVDVVENYFEISGIENYRLDVDVEQGVNFRRVNAYAEADINTLFMNMFGIRMLTSPALGTAEEIIPNVEVSLVLDISGSMRFGGTPTRMDRLRPAARNFVTRILEGDRWRTTTINLIPYAGQVNPGAAMFNLIGGQRAEVTFEDEDGNTVTVLRDHPRSHCIELSSTDFDRPGIPQAATFPQSPHFMNWAIDNPTMDWGWCPLEGDIDNPNSSAIVYLSNNEAQLHEYINRMRLHDGTGTHFGMLWGLWLLDPTSNWAIQALNAQGIVLDSFADRPSAYDDPETLKVVVLMTDGNITEQIRPRFPDRSVSPINADDLADMRLNHTRELDRQNNNTHCGGSSCRRTVSGLDASIDRNNNVDSFEAVCDAAKDNDIVVFTIAFDVGANSAAANQMRYCASSPSHFYDVDGDRLDSAFQSIAGAINQLRLIQ